MTEYSLQPSYVRLDYSSPFGTHSQSLPTVQWLPTSITGAMGSYVAWNTVPVDAEAMIDDFVTLAKAFLGTDYSYDLATVFNFDMAANKFIPVALKSLGVAGTGATAQPRKAVSQTFNLRSVGGQAAKIVFLDASIGAHDFDKQTILDVSPAALALVAEYADTGNGWAARDNTRPNALISVTYDVNDALRKQYGMI